MAGHERRVSKVVRFALVGSTVLVVAFLVSPYSVSFVRSDSMAPAIPEGSAYLLKPADGIHRGDVITFYAPTTGGYVTHRVVGTTPDGFLTKGDANAYVDQNRGFRLVTGQRIRGEVVTLGGEPIVLPHGRLITRSVAGNSEYVSADRTKTILVSGGVEKTSPAPFDWDDDGRPELLFVTKSDHYLTYVDYENGDWVVETAHDASGGRIPVRPETGVA